jgi:WD40 repeat protein
LEYAWYVGCVSSLAAAAVPGITALRTDFCASFIEFNIADSAWVLVSVLQCHRHTEEGVDVVFPVNAVAYNPMFGTFATGGGDGVVNIWDGNNKKRLFQVGGLVMARPLSCIHNAHYSHVACTVCKTTVETTHHSRLHVHNTALYSPLLPSEPQKQAFVVAA